MLSLCHVTAAQAENYYEKDDYYTQDLLSDASSKPAKSSSYWYGNGSETLGLKGQVESATFKDLLRGEDLQGNCLHARPIDPAKHRAATDYTFSAPKSVSIAGLIQQDPRVIDAHDQAVATALSVLESRYAQVRISTPEGRQRIGTGNITAAVFRHETSREQDPQLHSHCVVINTTQLADGTWRSLSNEEVIANQKLLGEIYQNDLAYQLRQLGYGIEAKTNGQFELIGYSQRLLDTFSTRSQQIKDYIKQWEQDIEQTGGAPLNAKQKKLATLNTRQAKRIIPREVLLRGWAQAIQDQALALPRVPQVDRDLRESSRVRAAVAVQIATQHAAERESVFKRSKVERFALEHYLGRQSFGDLQVAIAQSPELIPIDLANNKYTTQTAINRERDTLKLMRDGQQQVNAIANATDIMELFNRHSTLTSGQRQAIELSLKTHDQIIAWQGVAGSGKTYSLKLVAEQSAAKGHTVRGLAPSAEAATVLGQAAEISSDTVASWLNTQTAPEQLLGKEIWILDEAGLLSTKDAYALLLKASEQQARVILVGDTRQLSAVEAGNPFRSLQTGGIATAYIDQSLRQKTQDLREAVALMAAGDAVQSLQKLDQTGVIQEIPHQGKRLAKITQDYLSWSPLEREKTLILAGTNQERLMLTRQIRQALQVEGSLASDAFPAQALRPKDLTTVQANYAQNYAIGDVIVPAQTYHRQGLEKNQRYRIVNINAETNQLSIQAEDGQTLRVDPACCERKSVYLVQSLPIAIGDRLRWTKNNRDADIRNGQTFIVNQIDDTGKAQVTNADGSVIQVNLTGYQHIDYAWVSTTYGSQGKTADRVLAALDHTTNRESLYVAISRAKQHLTLYTADRTELHRLAQISRAKANASDYIPLFQVVQTDAQTPQTHQTSPTHHGHRTLGERLGNRINASLSTRLPGAQHPDARELGVSAAISHLSRSANDLSRTLAAVSYPNRHATEPTPPDLNRIAQAIRNQIDTERLSQTVRAAHTILHQIEHAVDTQHHLTATNLRRLGQIESAFRRRFLMTPPEFKALAPRRQPTTRDYQRLWQHYSQGIQPQNSEHLTSLVGLKALADGQHQTTVEQMILAGSPRVQALLVNHPIEQIKQAATTKVQYLSVLAAAQQEMRQASAQKTAHYQQHYQRYLPKYQFFKPWERDARIAQAGFKPDRSNLGGVVKMLYQSPEMQRLAPDAACEHLISVLKTANQRHRDEMQAEVERQQKTQRQKSQGFEMD
jgi:conjugative relaxase-like TrwC/TraI family protein